MIGKHVPPSVGANTQFQPGQSGNPAGKPKGRRSLSTIIRDMLEEEMNWDLLPNDFKSEEFRQKYGGRSAWEALVYTAYARSMAGDVKAMQWLSRSGYGDRMTIENEQGFFSTNKLEIEIVESKATDEPDSSASDGTTEQSPDS